MRELDELLKINRWLRNIDEQLEELKTVILSPKNQVITGLPRGGKNDNVLDKYLIKVEELEQRKIKLITTQMNEWQKVIQAAQQGNISDVDMELLYYRFVKGYTWGKCSEIMTKEYGRWNINKVFRKYRYMLRVFDKNAQ